MRRTLMWNKKGVSFRQQDKMNLDLWPREKTILCHKRPYKAIKRPHEATRGHTRPHKATRGQTRPSKANTAIQYHNVTLKITLCSYWNIRQDLKVLYLVQNTKSVNSKSVNQTEKLFLKSHGKYAWVVAWLMRKAHPLPSFGNLFVILRKLLLQY